jgi:hypothetical protein
MIEIVDTGLSTPVCFPVPLPFGIDLDLHYLWHHPPAIRIDLELLNRDRLPQAGLLSILEEKDNDSESDSPLDIDYEDDVGLTGRV